MKGTRMQKGITLISLIITIIVLIILAMVAIAAVQDSGIISKAKDAIKEHQIAREKETITLSIDGWKLEKQINKVTTFKSFMENSLREEAGVEGPDEGPLTVIFKDTKNQYIVTDDGTIIFVEKNLIVKDENGNIITDSTITVEVGKTKVLTVEKTGGLEGEITYKSSDDAIVTIDEDGKVTGIAEGTTKITISCGEHEIECEVIVVQPGENPPSENESIGALTDDGNPLTIRAIEDLVDFAMVINAGDPDGIYTGKTVTLETSLDFKDKDVNAISSYRDASSESYGDLNGNGDIESIKTELTTGAGFTPIGTINENGLFYFKGIFEGNNNTLYNIHINRPNDFAVGLFGLVESNITIQNLKITGNMAGNAEYGCVGGIIGVDYSESGGEIKISNCDIADMNFSAAGISGILGMVMSNNNITITDCEIAKSCSFSDNISGGAGICNIGQGMNNNLTIKNCINNVDISGSEVAGIVVCAGESDLNNVVIENCENNGKISGVGTSSEDVNIAGVASLYDDCSINGNVRIVGCTNNGELTTNYGPVAGIFNSTYWGDEESVIDNCVNNGTIKVAGDIRNISGIAIINNDNLVISNCVNNGQIEVKDSEDWNDLAGILIGSAKKIQNCVNNGKISVENGIERVAGIYIVSNEEDINLNVENCINKGTITINQTGLKYYEDRIISGIGFVRYIGYYDNFVANVRISNCTNEEDIIANFEFDTSQSGASKGEIIIAGVNIYNGDKEESSIELENLINSGNISTNGHIVSGVYYGDADTLIAKQCENIGNVTTTHSEGKAYGVIGGTITNKTETECVNTGTITKP